MYWATAAHSAGMIRARKYSCSTLAVYNNNTILKLIIMLTQYCLSVHHNSHSYATLNMPCVGI